MQTLVEVDVAAAEGTRADLGDTEVAAEVHCMDVVAAVARRVHAESSVGPHLSTLEPLRKPCPRARVYPAFAPVAAEAAAAVVGAATNCTGAVGAAAVGGTAFANC